MNNKRHDHGGVSHVQKERGATSSETAPHGTLTPPIVPSCASSLRRRWPLICCFWLSLLPC